MFVNRLSVAGRYQGWDFATSLPPFSVLITLESLRGIFFSGSKTLSAEATLEQDKSVSFILIILT
mgnify:CR=1 FL=1